MVAIYCFQFKEFAIRILSIQIRNFSSEETAFDNQSSSLIKLNNSTILYLREVNKFLALVCILREDNFSRQGIIDYNFLCFREAISQVFELRLKNQKSETLEQHDEDDDDFKPTSMRNGGSMTIDSPGTSVNA